MLKPRPVRLVTLGYLLYIVIGSILLAHPWFRSTDAVSGVDALFTATSALSTTGLTTVSTGNDYNLAGQIVILILIQLGGIGYMTLGSFVVLSGGGTLSERRQQIGKAVFSMPEGFRIDKFIKSVIEFTFIIEALGAVALFAAFTRLGTPNRVWASIFHSVSAFCTAGFGLYDTSFEHLRADLPVNAILGALSYLGAIGFIVLVDAWRRLTGKISRLTLTSRVILVATGSISVVGVALFFFGEPSIQHLPVHERLLASAFQVMAAITTVGFNTIPIGKLSQASLFLVTMLMIVGSSPSGTGGGLKTTTVSALFGVVKSVLRGRTQVRFWGRAIPEERVWVASASLCLYALTLIAGSYLLSLTETFPFEGLVFECASALGTVGLSTGITAQLTDMGKIIVTAVMYLGRVGPLAFGMALFLPSKTAGLRPSEDLAL
jgi:trk system potassium uptake protein TrkH